MSARISEPHAAQEPRAWLPKRHWHFVNGNLVDKLLLEQFAVKPTRADVLA
jgi:hypothetical protein